MSITAKELAARLNLSATAVSMALNGKTGVSTETRALVIRESRKSWLRFQPAFHEKKCDRRYLLHYLPGS